MRFILDMRKVRGRCAGGAWKVCGRCVEGVMPMI